jgi:Tol biopolymer transport system component
MGFRRRELVKRFGLGAVVAAVGGSAWTGLLVAAILALALAATGLAASPQTEPVSVSSSGEQGNRDSLLPAISADGRYVAFTSGASNLVSGDTNGESDVFVRDRELGTTERVSVSSTGRQGNRGSFGPAISANGRYVAFTSAASNLVARDTNRGYYDVFVRDRKLDTTKRVSVSSTGRQGNLPSGWPYPAISADGRYVAFASSASNLVRRDTNGRQDVFVRDRKRHTTRRVSVSSTGRQQSHFFNRVLGPPAISANGRYVAFTSPASNLVRRDTNRRADVFVRDRRLDKTRRVSVASNGDQGNGSNDGPAISADGRYVAFTSRASNLVPRDTNGKADVFVRDRKLDKTRRVSGQHGGIETPPAISASGRYVAFQSGGVYVRDRKLRTTEMVSAVSAGHSYNPPAISADGRYVAFTAYSLVAPHYRWVVFVRGPLR